MIVMGAFHNFIKVNKAKHIGLKVQKINGWLKVLNLETKLLNGVARDTKLHLDPWRGKANFSVIPLDDFTLVSTMQTSKGCKRHEETFLATIHGVDNAKTPQPLKY